MKKNGKDVYFTIVLSAVAIFLDQCGAVIYERHIIHVPLYIHVVHHHHHRQSKGQKLQKVPNFRPLPPLQFPKQQHPQQNQQHQQQNQQYQQQHQQNQHFNQNLQHSAQIIHPRHPQQMQQQKGGSHPSSDAQWIHPSRIRQMLNPPGSDHRDQKPESQRLPVPGASSQVSSPGLSAARPIKPTLHSRRPASYRVPSSVRYVARHRIPPANDISSYWYAYG